MIDITYFYLFGYIIVAIFSFFLYFGEKDYYLINPTKKKSLVTIILSLTWIVSIPIIGAYSGLKETYRWWVSLPDE